MTRASLALLLLLWAGPASAQAARVLVANEPLRTAPSSTVLARLAAGAQVQVGTARNGWREATLEGWIAGGSVRADIGSGGVVVIAPGGDDVRAAANGPAAARVPAGVFLERLDADGAWVHVRRSGWMRDGAVRLEAGVPLAAPAAEAGVAPAGAAPALAPPAAPRAGARAGESGAAVLARAGADTLAQLQPFAPLEVIGREGGWTHVRVDGWIWTADLAGAADAAGVLTDVTAAAMIANPDAYRGRVVAWQLQLIALRSAEPIRTDFKPGEPFLLTRGPGRETGFVYIGVPARLLPAARRLEPLQRIRVLARVRTGRSPLMGAPVLDLVELH